MQELINRMRAKYPSCWIWVREAEVVKASEYNGHFFAIARYKIGKRWKYLSGVVTDCGLYASPDRDPEYRLEYTAKSLAEAKSHLQECITFVKESYLHV